MQTMNGNFKTALSVIALVWSGSSSAQSYTFESTTNDSGPGMGRNGQTTHVRGSVAGDDARIDFIDTPRNGMFVQEGYMLSRDGGSEIILVDTKDETYTRMDLNALFGVASSMLEAMGGVVEMEFENAENNKIFEGPGEEILGYPTIRHEFETSYTINVDILGFSRSMQTSSRVNISCISGFNGGGPNFWMNPSRFRTGNEDIDAIIQQQSNLRDCMPGYMRSETVNSGMPGGNKPIVSETQLTALDTVSGFPDGTFSYPAHFTEKSMTAGMEGLGGAQNPEGLSAQGVEQASQGNVGSDDASDSSDDEDENPLRRLRGMFGR